MSRVQGCCEGFTATRFFRGLGYGLLALAMGLSWSGGAQALAAGAHPNILLILADDLGNNDIGSWGDGQVKTPTLDELSRESLRFRRHYTDSTCSPSRAALLTGRHPVSIGFQANGLGLSADLETLPESLKALGYRTAHIGKWHLGEALEYPEIQPGRHGFDYWFGFLNHFVLQGPGPDGGILRRRPTHIDPWLQENGGPPTQHPGYLDNLLTDKAIELMRRGQPWFINLWLYSPHTPYQPAPEFKRLFPDTPQGNFLAVMKQLDHNVGRLLAALDETGQASNTLVVFASDNGGPNLVRDNNFPLEGMKATYLEGGVRSPLLIRWPGKYENRDVQSISHIADLYPTLLSMAGGKVPAGLMGRDLSPALNGRAMPGPDQLFWAAEANNLELTYGGHLLDEGRLFYRDIAGKLVSAVVTKGLGAPRPDEAIPVFDSQQASRAIAAWERRARAPAFDWHPPAAGRPAFLSGRDFQRAPVFGGYSLGLALGAPEAYDRAQVLLDQPGVWSIRLEPDGRLYVRHADNELFSQPVRLNATCNTLVASLHIQPQTTYPFPGPASSRLILYLNGSAVLDSTRLLQRPATAAPLAASTFIGAQADGTQRYSGSIGRPQVVNKLLLPEQEGYGLADMLKDLCPMDRRK